MYGNEKYTDDELERALIEANGQPTKAAEILGVDYSNLYRRVRKNPKLLEVQNAYRARTFNNVSNLALKMLLTGLIDEPETDEDGNVIEGKFAKKKVDYRTRVSLIPNIMQTFKVADGLKDQLEVTGNGNIGIEEWIAKKTDDKNAGGL